MDKLIFDTSVWIDYLGQKRDVRTVLLDRELRNREQINICTPIVQEILQGIREDGQFNKVKKLLNGLYLLESKGWENSIGAATLYRNLRKKGVTVRKPYDCLIAWYAIENSLVLVHNDRDFESIASNTELKISTQ